MSGLKTFSPVVPSCRGIDPFQMHEWEEEKEGTEKRGLPSDAETRGGEWIGRVRTVCWFSSPDFTLRDKSWSVMEGVHGCCVNRERNGDNIIVKPRHIKPHLVYNRKINEKCLKKRKSQENELEQTGRTITSSLATATT